MVDMFFVSLTKDKDIINIDIDKDSEFVLEEGIHSILKRQSCVLIILLHDSSFVYPKGCLECGVLLMLRNNVGTCILHPFLVLFPQLIRLIPSLFHLFPVSIIVISVVYYDISGCSYSYSSTRIFITHLVYMLLFTPLFLYATLFHTSLTCVWLSWLRTSLHYFLSQLVSSTTLFSRSLLYLVTGILHLVRRITTLSPAHTHCSLEYLRSPATHSAGSTLSH